MNLPPRTDQRTCFVAAPKACNDCQPLVDLLYAEWRHDGHRVRELEIIATNLHAQLHAR